MFKRWWNWTSACPHFVHWSCCLCFAWCQHRLCSFFMFNKSDPNSFSELSALIIKLQKTSNKSRYVCINWPGKCYRAVCDADDNSHFHTYMCSQNNISKYNAGGHSASLRFTIYTANKHIIIFKTHVYLTISIYIRHTMYIRKKISAGLKISFLQFKRLNGIKWQNEIYVFAN